MPRRPSSMAPNWIGPGRRRGVGAAIVAWTSDSAITSLLVMCLGLEPKRPFAVAADLEHQRVLAITDDRAPVSGADGRYPFLERTSQGLVDHHQRIGAL